VGDRDLLVIELLDEPIVIQLRKLERVSAERNLIEEMQRRDTIGKIKVFAIQRLGIENRISEEIVSEADQTHFVALFDGESGSVPVIS